MGIRNIKAYACSIKDTTEKEQGSQETRSSFTKGCLRQLMCSEGCMLNYM